MKFTIWCVVLLLTGCSSILDKVIPKHKDSEVGAPDLVCVTTPGVTAESPAILALVAPIAIGFAVDQAVKGMEVESDRYKCSYSGRATPHLLKVTQEKDGQPPKVEVYAHTLRISRYHGQFANSKGCPSDQTGEDRQEVAEKIEQNKVMEFEAALKLNPSKELLTITPTRFLLHKTKAKVSWFHSVVDVNAQITLSTFVAEDHQGQKKSQQADLAQVDFPIGKVDLSEDRSVALNQLKSAYIALPIINYSSSGVSVDKPRLVLPVNVTMTIMESDDFGDVIAKTSKTINDNKQKIVEGALKSIGLSK